VAAAGYERDYKDGLLVQCGGDALMGTVGAYPGGGIMGLEQFVSYDATTSIPAGRLVPHGRRGSRCCLYRVSPGKEALYIEMRYTDEQAFDKWAVPSNPGPTCSSARYASDTTPITSVTACTTGSPRSGGRARAGDGAHLEGPGAET
jgi:hypothetical protein